LALSDGDLVLDGGNKFRVHTRAYADPEVFAREMKRVFGATWVFVAHESEIPQPGDYRTSHIGLEPVIVCRGDERELNVLVNRCVHRGSVICREARGSVKHFECPYHGWVYTRQGKLAGISDRRGPGGYGESFEPPEGLFRVPRVESYRGFIFASLNPDVPPLAEHLGEARTIIDRRLNHSLAGTITLRSAPYVIRYRGNWKFQAENTVDNYHFLSVHQGFVKIQAKYGDSTGDFGVHKGGSVAEMRQIRDRGRTWGCRQGHGLSETPAGSLEELLNGPFGDYYRQLQDQHGPEELLWIAGKGAALVFPNVGFIFQQFRVWRPIAPDLAEVTVYHYNLTDAPAALNEGTMRSEERFYGPAGHGMADDVDVFVRVQQGMAASSVQWTIVERGLESDTLTPDGDHLGLPQSEAPLRAFWRRWQRDMS
jgi:benzoate/toluate 1,2-dioxygenase alpha subunit